MTFKFEPLNESHFPLLLKWLEAPHVKKWWPADRSLRVGGGQDVTYTMDLVEEKYESYVKGYKKIDGVNKPIYAYIIKAETRAIGYIQIYNAYDFPRSKPLSNLPANLGAFDIFIGEAEALGQGLGSTAILEFLKLRGNEYSYIFAGPGSNNVAAIKCYETAGFERISEHEDIGEVWMIKKLKKVRLSDYDFSALEFCFKKHFLEDDRLWLFGSRADLTAKGGDIDLYIATYVTNVNEALKRESSFVFEFEEMIGEQKIDVVLNMINNPYPLAIHEIAKTKGVRII